MTVLHMSTLFFALLKNHIFSEFAFKITSYFRIKKIFVLFFIKNKHIKNEAKARKFVSYKKTMPIG